MEYKSEKVYDLGAREVILPPFDSYSNGKYMPAAHMFANGGSGILRALTPINDSVEIISEEIGFDKRRHSPALTRFVNSLGGKDGKWENISYEQTEKGAEILAPLDSCEAIYLMFT